MDLKEQIKAAVGAHGLWKGRLKNAIDTGKADVTVADVQSDHNCAFGKWLQGLDASQMSCASCKACKDLHAKFHMAAASVLALALAGKKQEALKALAVDSQFGKLSVQLTNALMAWSRTA